MSGDFNERHLVLLGPAGLIGLLVAFGVALTAFYLSWKNTFGLAPRRRALVLGLRAGSLGAALMLLAQPALELRKTTPLVHHLAVLVDSSESMQVAEDGGRGGVKNRRIDRARVALENAKKQWDKKSSERSIDVYTFGERLEVGALNGVALSDPRARHSKLESAILEMAERYKTRDLGGVLIVSDGAFDDALGRLPLDGASLDRLTKLGTPVSTAYAAKDSLWDVAIADVAADDFAFVHNAVDVEVTIRTVGVKPQRAEVSLIEERPPGTAPGERGMERSKSIEIGGEPDSAALAAGERGVTSKVTFRFTPERIGKFVYRVEIPPLPGEAVTENNRRRFVLRVVRDKIRVLQVCGRPSWDESFLRKLLKRNPNVDLISFFILRTQSDLTMAAPNELALIPFPTDELFEKELPSFDLIVLQNFNFGPYGIAPYLPHIRKFVENGGGLMMLGGELSFSSGGYAETPVAAVLPVDLLPNDLPATRLINEEDFNLKPTVQGLRHPVMALGHSPDDSEIRWSKLPALDGVNLVARARPGATVLGTHPRLRGADGQPLPALSAIDVGKGRSLALLSDGTWRWDFVAGGNGDASRPYDRFWENAIRWLIKDPALTLVRISADRSEYTVGEPMELGVRAFDVDYRPAVGMDVEVVVSQMAADPAPPGMPAVPSPKPLLLRGKTDEQGELRLRLRAPQPGAWRAVAKARLQVSDPSLAEGDDVFVVRTGSRELDDPIGRRASLAAIAKATGGEALTLPADLTDIPMRKARAARVERRKDVPLWDSAGVLVALFACLLAEWVLRRRSGLA